MGVAVMSSPKFGTNEPNMTCAISMAQNLERKERARGLSVAVARQSLARKLRVGGGTFERLVRGRIKRVDAGIRDRLQALLVRELEAEIARLTHELEIARQSGASFASLEISEVETHLARAKEILSGRA
jgi:hypothetical protein